jgi:hypothetical protein
LPHIFSYNFIGFDSIKVQYAEDVDFGSKWNNLSTKSSISRCEYFLKDGYLFYGTLLCLPHRSFREFVITELHGEGLAGHFGYDKTCHYCCISILLVSNACIECVKMCTEWWTVVGSVR